MRERPILFSSPMVRAILAGTKTQTRRIVKLPHENPLGQWEPTVFGGPNGGRTKDGETIPLQGGIWHTRTGDHLGCPYGQPGDRLWVREAWRILGDSPYDTLDMFDRDDVQYRADDDQSYIDKYRPSSRMPRRFSRITLEVTGVRVERLQDIRPRDILAEGAVERPHVDQFGRNPVSRFDGKVYLDLRSLWAAGWNQINGPDSWGANPWVWVIEFRRT